MNPLINEKVREIQKKIQELSSEDLSFQVYEVSETKNSKVKRLIQSEIQDMSLTEQKRIMDEFDGFGPIDQLMRIPSISEIIVNGPRSIWYEKDNMLFQHEDNFSSSYTYSQFANRICHLSGCHFSLNRPAADGKLEDFRVHVVSEQLTRNEVSFCFRRHPQDPWTFSRLLQNKWAEESQISVLQKIIERQENFLVVGSTGSGKTSLLNACLQHLRKNERAVVIEDTAEIVLPNQVSTKLLSRQDCQGILPGIDQAELVKQSLRMRPDRIVMGEIRGGEAKDLLMALSTGHAGSFGSLHAADARQALIRLEMLIQFGAPFWSLDAIRNLIFLSLQHIVVVARTEAGRKLTGIFSLSSRESSGILVDRIA
jgi:pilus assembly protein CpaF